MRSKITRGSYSYSCTKIKRRRGLRRSFFLSVARRGMLARDNVELTSCVSSLKEEEEEVEEEWLVSLVLIEEEESFAIKKERNIVTR